MDIASLSMGLANSRTLSDVGTAMLGKTLDMSREQGGAMVEMLASSASSRGAMEQSVNPAVGSNFDMSV